jgi:hypothetical protein
MLQGFPVVYAIVDREDEENMFPKRQRHYAYPHGVKYQGMNGHITNTHPIKKVKLFLCA